LTLRRGSVTTWLGARATSPAIVGATSGPGSQAGRAAVRNRTRGSPTSKSDGARIAVTGSRSAAGQVEQREAGLGVAAAPEVRTAVVLVLVRRLYVERLEHGSARRRAATAGEPSKRSVEEKHPADEREPGVRPDPKAH
jgi:hypothetical protein